MVRIADDTIKAQNQTIRDLGAKLFAYSYGDPNAMIGSSPESATWL